MTRPKGSVDADYSIKRAAILNRLKPHLMKPGSRDISFSGMAALAGVSIPTLRHYFPRRCDVISGLLAHIGEEGRPYIQRLAEEDIADLKESLLAAGKFIALGVERGQVAQIHALGLNEGMGEPVVGPNYLNSILEPTLQAMERRLERLIRQGAMRDCDTRYAALNFVAPILIAYLHQRQLGGDCVRPMDIEELINQQVAFFVIAYESIHT